MRERESEREEKLLRRRKSKYLEHVATTPLPPPPMTSLSLSSSSPHAVSVFCFYFILFFSGLRRAREGGRVPEGRRSCVCVLYYCYYYMNVVCARRVDGFHLVNGRTVGCTRVTSVRPGDALAGRAVRGYMAHAERAEEYRYEKNAFDCPRTQYTHICVCVCQRGVAITLLERDIYIYIYRTRGAHPTAGLTYNKIKKNKTNTRTQAHPGAAG